MSLLDRVKQANRIRRLRSSVSRLPTPQDYAELAELYIQRGQVDLASCVAEEGLELFPNARRLREVSRFSKRQELQARVRRLDATLRHRPHPGTYTELATIYWDLGDMNRAEEISVRCAREFPDNENPYLIVGEIRLERFLDEGLERDGRLAAENLEKVAALNHNNVKSHLHLARLFHAAGAVRRCCSHLRAMLSITPTAREIREFLTALEREVDAGEEEDLEELLAEIERSGRFARDPEDFPSVKGMRPTRHESRLDLEELQQGMAELARTPGVRRAVVLDADGEVVLEAGDIAQPSRTAFTTLVRSLGETAFDLSRRMDIGTVERADIEGDFGVLRLIRLPGVLSCVLVDSARVACRALDEFVARSFASRRAADHA